MIIHRRRLLAGLVASPALFALPETVRAQDGTPANAALDEVFASAAPPAMAAGVVSAEGLAWAGVRGVRRSGEDEAATLQDRWHLGSNTKAMTAAVFARLVEQGRARWAMPLAEAFPGVTIDPAWGDATLDDLMHHRAGLRDDAVMGRPWLMTARADPRSLPEQRRAIAEQALAAAPAGPRGEFAYGNANYVLVGAAIEQITGQAWEDAMREQLFGPLGLDSAGFGPPPGRDNPWAHLMLGETRTPIDPTHPGADNPLAMGPAGTAHMSLADYARFVSAIMGGAPGWLSGASLAHLLTPAAGSPPGYACGWSVREQPWGGVGGAGPVIGHDGSNTMWHATVVAAPQRRRALIVLANDGPTGSAATRAMTQKLLPIAFAP